MAVALAKMLSTLGMSATIFYEGTAIMNEPYPTVTYRTKIVVKQILNLLGKKYYIPPIASIETLLKKLTGYDAIVVVGHMPTTFAKANYTGVDILKKKLNVPIINYDLCFLATHGMWVKLLKKDPKYGGFAGLNRFDYYMAVSITTEYPLKKDVMFPVSCIGGDFQAENLFPEQEEFMALVDFERESHPKERALQLQALKETDTKYYILHGTYSADEIRNIYRKSAIYFLAHRESFGLPIVELQHCGCLIFTPYKRWAPAHYLFKSPYERGEGQLGTNFKVYRNDLTLLKSMIQEVKTQYNAHKVVESFKKEYPMFYTGNLAALSEVMNKIQQGVIHAQSHNDYKDLDQEIILD